MAKTTLLQKVTELTEQLRVMTKERDDAKQSLKYAESRCETASKERAELQAQVDELHSLLDALPNPVPRVLKTEDRWGSEQTIENTLMVRFAASLTRR